MMTKMNLLEITMKIVLMIVLIVTEVSTQLYLTVIGKKKIIIHKMSLEKISILLTKKKLIPIKMKMMIHSMTVQTHKSKTNIINN